MDGECGGLKYLITKEQMPNQKQEFFCWAKINPKISCSTQQRFQRLLLFFNYIVIEFS